MILTDMWTQGRLKCTAEANITSSVSQSDRQTCASYPANSFSVRRSRRSPHAERSNLWVRRRLRDISTPISLNRTEQLLLGMVEHNDLTGHSLPGPHSHLPTCLRPLQAESSQGASVFNSRRAVEYNPDFPLIILCYSKLKCFPKVINYA